MRNRSFLALDVVLLAFLPLLALAVRFESFNWPPEYTRAVIIYAVLALPLRLASAYLKGLYRCMWRHASIMELERILYVGLIAGVATFFLGSVGITAIGVASTRLPYSAL